MSGFSEELMMKKRILGYVIAAFGTIAVGVRA